MRALAALLVAAWAMAGAAWAQSAVAPAAFRDAVIARIQQFDPDADVAVRGALSFEIEGDLEITVRLDNAYAEYQRNPAEYAWFVDRYARFALAPRGEAGNERQRIVTVLRPRAVAEELARLEAGRSGPPSTFLWRPFAGDLVQVVVLDSAE